MIRSNRWNKAFSAVIAGTAFFLWGCQVMVPVKQDVLKEARDKMFESAEKYWKRGEFHEETIEKKLDFAPLEYLLRK